VARTVLLLHGSASGYGADRQLLVIATGLDPARYRPLVVLPEHGQLAERLDEAGVEVRVVPVAVLKRSLMRGRRVASTAALVRRSAHELASLAFERKAALLHTNTSIVLGGQRAARLVGVPHLLHVREIYRGAGGRPGALLWPLLRARLLAADGIACVSELVAGQLGGSERAFVLHDAVPRELALASRAAARAALGLGEDRFAVAVVGRISDWKGQDVVARALADPALANIGAVALVAGDAAPGQEHFERRLAELRDGLGLGDRLRLLGFRDDVEAVLAAADAVVVPSTHPEAFPNSALEGALAGLPVVATNNGGQVEIVRDGYTGRLVPPGDHAALAAVVRALADDPAGARRLGAAAAVDVDSRFGQERLLDQLQARYDGLVERSRRAAWLLPIKRLSVPQPVATDVRLSHLEAWLRQAGYVPRIFSPPGLRSTPGLVGRALRERPALVLTSAAVCAPALAAIKRLLGRRVLAVADVMGLHSLEVDQALGSDRARPLVRRIWIGLERLLFGSVDLVLTVNERHAAVVRRRYRPAGVHALPFAAEAELAETAPAERSAIGIPPDAIAVGFVGSLIYSRLEPLFSAWRELEADGRLCLVIVGDGPDLAAYLERARAAGWLGRSVLFLGGLPRAEALGVVRACDIAYSECWSEAGFPYKLFEYMALGMPIVTEGKPQIAEVLEDGRDALFFRTPGELAERIGRLAADPELRERLGTRARESFAAAHTLEHRGRLLAALLDGGPPPRDPPARPRPRLASVVVPVRNGEEHLADQLAALAAQTYAGAWELVVVDNGCTDRSIALLESWRDRLPPVVIADARARRGLNFARNRGAEAAGGDLLCFCDADDVVASGWLEALVEASARADLVGGAIDHETLNGTVHRAWRPTAPRDDLLVHGRFLPYVPGGNCAVWADVAREIGWDESFRFGSSDVEFSWRAHLASYRLAYAPGAVLRLRHRTSLSGMARQYYAYGKSGPQLYRRFRRHGMPREEWRAVRQRWRLLVRRAPGLVRSAETRGDWLRLAAVSGGRLVGSIRWRVVFL
jgi:glycosyltransferase involved in cell wall biosynthesis